MAEEKRHQADFSRNARRDQAQVSLWLCMSFYIVGAEINATLELQTAEDTLRVCTSRWQSGARLLPITS